MIFNHLQWLIPALVLLVALAIGFKDVSRFSWYRTRAVASVCFRESIRRRVLLVIPLAILGVLAVSAFTKPIDEQDSIRQTLKFCLFASGLLIVVTLIILACTNLPREIDNRVIYTIVTKPTTRLEIVIGKIVGFAGVSGVVLLIMGLFTWSYLGLTALRYHSSIAQRLEAGDVGKAERGSLEHYENFGLLTAKRLSRAQAMLVATTIPGPDDAVRWFGFSGQGDAIVPLTVGPQTFDPILAVADDDPAAPRLVISLQIQQRPWAGRAAPTTAEATSSNDASVQINLLSPGGDLIADAQAIGATSRKISGSGVNQIFVVIPKTQIANLAKMPRFFVQIVGESPGKEFGLGKYPVQAAVVSADNQSYAPLDTIADGADPTRQQIGLRGRQGRSGQQVEGDPTGRATAALYQFRKVQVAGSNPNVGLEVRVGIERSNDEDDVDDVLSELELTFINRSPGAAGGASQAAGGGAGTSTGPGAASGLEQGNSAGPPTAVVRGYPENNRTLYLTVPRAAVAGGDFDVIYRSKSKGHWISADGASLVVVTSREPFFINLFCSLLILWMMSLLVVIVSVFTSTFLSWPIAVVLTLLILLSRWALDQLGDALDSSIGNQMVSTMGINDPNVGKAVSKSVVTLTEAFKAVGSILPDITSFSAVQHIEQGLAVPAAALGQSGLTLVLFGLPMLTFAYVFLKFKEVAP